MKAVAVALALLLGGAHSPPQTIDRVVYPGAWRWTAPEVEAPVYEQRIEVGPVTYAL